MKKNNYIVVIAAVLLVMSGCSKWLDVNPRSEVRDGVMFSTTEGFKYAMNGAYILTAKEELYGKNTTMFAPEILARHWLAPTGNVVPVEMRNRLSLFDFENRHVEELFRTIWLEYYKVIVQLNDIITNLQESTLRFDHSNDLLMMGEALGLRAFLHLDLLRFFGPVPDENALSVADAIPYVTEKTRNPGQLLSLSFAEVIKHIEDDLNEAERLLAQVDPILEFSNWELNLANPPRDLQDDWHRWRQSRFNYFAVLGTKARFYHWIGNAGKANEYAKKVIYAENDAERITVANGRGTRKFTLTTGATMTEHESNLTFFSEQLFGIHNPELRRITGPLWANQGNHLLWQTQAQMNTAFEFTANPADIRYRTTSHPNRFFELIVHSGGSNIFHFKKFSGDATVPSRNRVPLLRLSEMYLILMENLPESEALSYFQTYRQSRGMDIAMETQFQTARATRLEREHRKEFMGEGQMFFFYKRNNFAAYTWPAAFTVPPGGYVIPKPNDQLKFE